MKTPFRWLVASLLIFTSSLAPAQTVKPVPGNQAHQQFRSFYKSSNFGDLPNLFSALERSGQRDWTDHPPIIGFMTGLRSKNVDVAGLLPKDASDRLWGDLAVAYSLAGERERGVALARQIGMDKGKVAFLTSQLPLARLPIRTPTELDYFWGAAFATGDARFVRPIVARFRAIADREKADAILAASRFVATKRGDLKWIKERFDRQQMLEIALASGILAALSYNGAEHQFVRDGIAAELPAGSPGAQILAAFGERF